MLAAGWADGYLSCSKPVYSEQESPRPLQSAKRCRSVRHRFVREALWQGVWVEPGCALLHGRGQNPAVEARTTNCYSEGLSFALAEGATCCLSGAREERSRLGKRSAHRMQGIAQSDNSE